MNLDPIILTELQRGGPPTWVSGRTYRAGQCVLSPMDWQVYMRATSGAGTVDPKNDGDKWVRWGATIEAALALVSAAVTNVNAAVGGVSAKADAIQATVTSINAARGVKSVQRGVATPVSGGGTVVPLIVNIAPVVPGKTMVNMPSLYVYQGNVGVNVEMKLRLLSATELEVTSKSTGSSGYSSPLPCAWEVIEWY